VPQRIRAVEDLGPSYQLLLIGRGAPPRIPACVTCLPFQSDAVELAVLLGACDLFVHPGQHETFGLVALEALSCGIPVLGVQGGGVGELVHETCGLLVQAGSSTALGKGIRRLFQCDVRVMGAEGRRRMLASYDWQHIMSQLCGHDAALAGVRWNLANEARLVQTLPTTG